MSPFRSRASSIRALQVILSVLRLEREYTKVTGADARWARVADRLNLVLTWFAPAVVVVLALQVAWTVMALGRMPVVYQDPSPTPGAVGVALGACSGWGIVLLGLGLPVWCVSWLGAARRVRVAEVWRRVLLFAGSVGILVGVAVVDPFGLWAWRIGITRWWLVWA